MRPGYVLIEILISLALGAIMIAALFASLFQINKGVKVADQIVEYDARVVLVQYQLEHDLSGAMVPYEFVSQKETTTEVKVTQTTPQATKKTETTHKETAKKDEPVEHSFYAEALDGNVKMLTFITTNPLPSYDSIKPRIARVTYQLTPEQQRQNMPPSYRLMREEQTVLKQTQQKGDSVQGHELARGIKSLKFEYRARPPQQEEPQKKEEGQRLFGTPQQQQKPEPQVQEKKKERPAYEKFPVWGKDQIEKVKQNLPQFVDITISLWDKLHKRDRTFVFTIALPVRDWLRPPEKTTKSEKTTQEDKKTEEQKTQQGGEQPSQPQQGVQVPEQQAQAQAAVAPVQEQVPAQTVNTFIDEQIQPQQMQMARLPLHQGSHVYERRAQS